MLCKNTTKHNTFMRKRQHFNEHAIFRVMALSEFRQKRKNVSKHVFCRPSRARWPNLMSRSEKTTPDAPTDTVATPLSEVCRERRGERMMHLMLSFSVHVWHIFFKQAENVRNRWKKNPRLSGNYVALCRGDPADIKKMRAERFELPTF